MQEGKKKERKGERQIDYMELNAVFSGISVISRRPIHLSMLSCSSFNQYSAQYSRKSEKKEGMKERRKERGTKERTNQPTKERMFIPNRLLLSLSLHGQIKLLQNYDNCEQVPDKPFGIK